MAKYLTTAAWGFFISALGAIPLGVLNITAMQVALHHGMRPAWAFALGVAAVEVLYARILLSGLRRLMQYHRLMQWLDRLALAIVVLLAAGAIYSALYPNNANTGRWLPAGVAAAFGTGIAMSAANPMQLPYWFGWSAVLLANGRLQPQPRSFNWYITGIGAGTLAGLSVFMYGGPWLSTSFASGQQWINWGVALVLVITAILFAWRMWRGKGTADKLQAAAGKHSHVVNHNDS